MSPRWENGDDEIFLRAVWARDLEPLVLFGRLTILNSCNNVRGRLYLVHGVCVKMYRCMGASPGHPFQWFPLFVNTAAFLGSRISSDLGRSQSHLSLCQQQFAPHSQGILHNVISKAGDVPADAYFVSLCPPHMLSIFEVSSRTSVFLPLITHCIQCPVQNLCRTLKAMSLMISLIHRCH